MLTFKHRPKPFPLAIACAFASPLLFAADDAAQLPEITVNQSRSAVVGSSPSPQAQVTAEQIRDINVINTEDTLKYVPSLNIRKRYIGDRNAVISARTSVGTVPSATSLVYVDGLLLSNLLGNSYSYPPRWNLVGAEEIASVDVLYGPFSALLPGNSIGATVLMSTRRPEKLEAHARVQAFQEHYANYGTDKDYTGQQAQISAGMRLGGLRISVLGNDLDSHGHPMSFANSSTRVSGAGVGGIGGYATDTDTTGAKRFVYGATSIDHTRQSTGKVRLDYDFSADTRAAFTWAEFRNDSYVTSDSYLKDSSGNTILTATNVDVGGGQYIAVKASDFSLSKAETLNRLLGLTFDSKLSNEWRLEAAASDYATPTDINRVATNGMSASAGGVGTLTYGKDSGWRNLDLKAIWKPRGAAAGHTVISGLHYDEYRLSSLKYNTDNWLSDSASSLQTRSVGKTRTDALFVQDAWKFDPRWTLTAGLRHERWQAYDGAYFERGKAAASGSFANRSESFNSPKASLAWQATPDWLLRASLARAYRMPTVAELFGTTSTPTGTTLADASLNPERVLAGDLTAEGAFAGGSLRVSLFHEDKNDYLYSQTTTVGPKITSFQNVGKTMAQGIETAYTGNDVLIRGLDLQASLTYTDSRVKENDKRPEYIGRALAIPVWRATVFATYHLNDAWSAAAGIRYASAFPSLDPAVVDQNTFGGSSRYTVADARVSYRFHKYMAAALGVDNLGSEKYYAYHPYPQRTIHAELRIDY